MAKDGKSYFVSIPNEVLYDELYPQAYRIAALISNMSHNDGFVWMDNEWLAGKLNISERTVVRSVSQLVERGHYSRYIDLMDDNKRYLSPLPESRLRLLVMAAKHPSSIDKSVYAPDSGADGKSEADTGPSIDKSVYTYGQKCPPSIDKNGVSSIDMYKKDVERGSLSLFEFLDPQKTKGKIYLAAKEKHLLLESPGFFDFFEEEVLKRFPRMNAGNVNNVTLGDWDKKVYAVYGAEIATVAVCNLVGEIKGGFPTFAEARTVAAKIKSVKENKEKTAKQAASVAERKAGGGEQYVPFVERTDADLAKAWKKLKDGETTSVSQFQIPLIEKVLQNRWQEVRKEKAVL